MDLEQLTKQVEWLDEEHRKESKKIKDLENKILSLEGKLDAADKKNKELDSEVTRLRMALTRVDDLDDELAGFRVEQGRKEKEFEKEVKGWIRETKNVIRTQIQGQETQMETLREEFSKVEEIERQMSLRIEEENKLHNTIGDVRKDINTLQRESEERKRQMSLAKEERQQELKRITDVQGEVTAIRKRLDEQRGRLDVREADLQKLTTRVEDLERIRRELRKEQDEFIEQHTLAAAEREKKWKNWKTRFSDFERRADEVADQVRKLDSTHQIVKRAKEQTDNLAEQVERRINEITEMQRLAEERFRQEWTSFKADDQKRWTNYTLTQNEHRSEIERQNRELGERLTILEDGTQEMHDQIRQLSSQLEKQMQALLSLIREWVANHEEIMDSIR